MTTDAFDVVLQPRDGFFCKDARGWYTSSSGRGHALDWPWPSTVRGAMRAAWGVGREGLEPFKPDKWREETEPVSVGRLLALRRPLGTSDWAARHRIWPAPRDALALENHDSFIKLGKCLGRPDAETLGSDEDPARERLLMPLLDDASKPRSLPKWWSDADFIRWLCDRGVTVPSNDNAIAMPRRVQAHVGIAGDTQTAEESILFAHDVIETLEWRYEPTRKHHEWAMALRLGLPDASVPETARIGSDARLADVVQADRDLFAFPQDLDVAFARGPTGLRIVTVSPALFEAGWLPGQLAPQAGSNRRAAGGGGGFWGVISLLFGASGKGRGNHAAYSGSLADLGLDSAGDLVLRAAFVGRPDHVSGWDMTGGKHGRGAPKRTDRMVPPGSVFYFERRDGKAFTPDHARALWLTALGERTNEGFGTIVPGVWLSNGRTE